MRSFCSFGCPPGWCGCDALGALWLLWRRSETRKIQPLGCLPFENSWRGFFELIRRDGKFTSSFALCWGPTKNDLGFWNWTWTRHCEGSGVGSALMASSWLRQSISKTSMLIGHSDYTFPYEASTKEKEAFGCVHLPLVYYHKGWSLQLHPSFWDLSKAYRHRLWCWDEHQGNSSCFFWKLECRCMNVQSIIFSAFRFCLFSTKTRGFMRQWAVCQKWQDFHQLMLF